MNIKKQKKDLSEAQVVILKENSKIFSILSIVFGLLSIFVLSILFVPLGVFFSFLGFLKKNPTNITLSVLGFVFSVIGLLTSPMLMSLIGFGFMR
ncbi:MAG: hypothetical protein K2Q34_08660 [Alphaproteobacteria bacterium]|nr:hypothetical protein [Alphaproteobacteria bacterium]